MQTVVAKRAAASAQAIRDHGYVVIKDFISPQTCDRAREEIDRLVEAFEPAEENITIFQGDGNCKHLFSKYFLDSSDKVRFFFEPKAFQDGRLTVPKAKAINKIGHALHEHNQIFGQITYTPGVWQLCQELGISDPLVMQSMAILKPPQIGNRVSIHQDSTFLYSEPQTLYGFWCPLQDATLENGCLWGLPGSHKGPLYSRSKVLGREPRDQRLQEIDYRQEDFIPLQMPKGSLAIFPGRFLHKSNDNTSKTSRYAYTWHLMDSTSEWSGQNWLQRPSFPKFIRS